jgi:RNA polymerase sigma-70 factor (ECF subfamily)
MQHFKQLRESQRTVTVCPTVVTEVNLMSSAEFLCPFDQSVDPDAADDDALVTAAQSGSESAFRELCRRNKGRVLSSISRLTRDHADAEDALQDSFMRAFVHINQFDRRSRFSTWLTSIAINSALMILRKRQRARETSFDVLVGEDNLALQWDAVDVSPNPEDICLFKELARTIDTAICDLPSKLRVVTELRLTQNLALHEIAAALNLSLPATKTRLCRAKRRIMTALRSTASARRTGQRDRIDQRGDKTTA